MARRGRLGGALSGESRHGLAGMARFGPARLVTNTGTGERKFEDLERPELQIMRETRGAGISYEVGPFKQRRVHIREE